MDAKLDVSSNNVLSASVISYPMHTSGIIVNYNKPGVNYLLPGRYMHPSRKTQPDNNIYQQAAISSALTIKIKRKD